DGPIVHSRDKIGSAVLSPHRRATFPHFSKIGPPSVLHRSIIFIHTAFLVLSAALAFLAVQQVQEVTPDDRGTVLWVRDSDRTISSEQFTSEVEAFSEERQVNIALETPGLRDPGGLRHLYVAVGDTNLPGGSWIDEGFADFSPDFQTDVHSFSSL